MTNTNRHTIQAAFALIFEVAGIALTTTQPYQRTMPIGNAEITISV